MTTTVLESHLEIVDLRLSARGLPDLSTFSNTDPFAVVYTKDGRKDMDTLNRIGVTETIIDTQNPNWTTAIPIQYMFECVQEVTIKLYHSDGRNNAADLSKHTFIGEVSFHLSQLMRSSAMKLSVDITDGKHKGTVEIQGEARAHTRDVFGATFSGVKLANKDGFFGKSDPFFQISRLNENGEWTVVFTSLRVDNDLSPKWKPVLIPMVTLCNGDLYRPLEIEIFDWDSDGKHDSMGKVRTSVNSMLTSNGAPFEVIEEKKKSKSGYKNSGHLTTTNCFIEPHPTFSDFVAGGCELSLIVGIDFTGSNGDPSDPTSLHYQNPLPNHYNEYQQAILQVCKILDPYDSDKMYPVFGYGAKVKQPDGIMSTVQHCFPVYGGGNEVHGVDGIMQAYKDCLNNVALSGPTLFTPLITSATEIARSANCSQEMQKYTILLILTDGEIMDMDDTITAIIRASYLPISIIIVGVGNENFESMRQLDKDVGLLKRGQEMACRDIVQFVSFHEIAGKGNQSLASEVLCEIPSQFLKYMERVNIVPNKK